MITKSKPIGKTLSPKNLHDILSGEDDKNINVIENIIQRELVWDYTCLETFWYDVLNLIKKNIEGKKEGYFGRTVYDKAYLDLGNIEHSVVDPCNKRYLKKIELGKYNSIVDGSQRNRICMFMIIAFMYEISKINQYDHIDLSAFKSSNGEFKLIEIGIEKLNDFYKKIETTPISQLEKEIKTLESLEGQFKNPNEERDYFATFSLFVNFIEQYILGTYDVREACHIVMENSFFNCEEIEKNYKWDRFVDRNKKGTPMSDEHMYPKYIANQFDSGVKEKVYIAFNRFKDKAEETQLKGRWKKDKIIKASFRRTKGGLDAMLYIMIEVLKIKLAESEKDVNLKTVFSSSFNLNNVDYGISKCFRDGIVFNTWKDAVDYFDECYNVAKFLIEDSFSKHDNIYDDYYYLRDFATLDVMWWYFIKPSYILHSRYRDTNREKFIFTKKLLYRIYVFYVIMRTHNTNSQNFINLLEDISCFLLTDGKELDNVQFCNALKERVNKYIELMGGYDQLTQIVRSLSYAIKSNIKTIRLILVTMEYDLCEKFSLPTEYFYSLWKLNDKNYCYNLDHWYPENAFKDVEDDIEYQRIGNLLLLEESLNKSKQDKSDVNARYYTQSNIISTKLLSKDNRGTFNNKVIEDINNYPYMDRFDDDELNNPSIESIKNRTKTIANFAVSFIGNFFKINENAIC